MQNSKEKYLSLKTIQKDLEEQLDKTRDEIEVIDKEYGKEISSSLIGKCFFSKYDDEYFKITSYQKDCLFYLRIDKYGDSFTIRTDEDDYNYKDFLKMKEMTNDEFNIILEKVITTLTKMK